MKEKIVALYRALVDKCTTWGIRLAQWDKRHWKAKFGIALAIVAMYAFFTGRHTLIEYYRLGSRESFLREQMDIYQPMLAADSARLLQIKSLGRQVEHVARELYLMKSPGEDIYLIKLDSEQTQD